MPRYKERARPPPALGLPPGVLGDLVGALGVRRVVLGGLAEHRVEVRRLAVEMRRLADHPVEVSRLALAEEQTSELQ